MDWVEVLGRFPRKLFECGSYSREGRIEHNSMTVLALIVNFSFHFWVKKQVIKTILVGEDVAK